MWYNIKVRPVGQAAKTLASHAGNMGSIPVRVTNRNLNRFIRFRFFRYFTTEVIMQKDVGSLIKTALIEYVKCHDE